MKHSIRISLGSVWETTIGFVRAESSLLLPLALLGFGLPTVAMLLAVPIDAAEAGMLKPGAWMFWLLPCGLFSMLGSIAVSALVLTPGISVRESIGIAIARLPAAIGLLVLYVGLQVVLAVPLALATLIDQRVSVGAGPFVMLVNLLDIAVMIWLFVRILPIWAVLADRPQSPMTAVRTAFRLTRGCYARLLALRIVMAVAAMIAMLVLLIPIGAVTQLIGMATGDTQLAIILSFVATGVVMAGVIGLWTVYVARLYRALEAATGEPISGI
jgi:hypothetical protein